MFQNVEVKKTLQNENLIKNDFYLLCGSIMNQLMAALKRALSDKIVPVCRQMIYEIIYDRDFTGLRLVQMVTCIFGELER